MNDVRIGARVKFNLDGEEFTRTLAYEVNDLHEINIGSPVGQVLATAPCGALVNATVPGGMVQVTVLEIHG